MRSIVVALFGLSTFVSTSVFAAVDLDSPEVIEWANQASRRCASGDHPSVLASDFGWGINFLQAADMFEKMYGSEKRLQHRFYYENDKGFLGKSNSYGKELLAVPVRFVYSLKRHIESALSLNYAQWVIFPDMGHTHFFIDEKDLESWQGVSGPELLEKFMNSPNTKSLYHTLEQIKVRDENKTLFPDAWSQWRYYTRNIVGDNQGLGHLEIHKNLTENYNTVRDYEGYKYWSGVNLSSNKNGCFSYEHNGKTFYFDVSFYDLPYSEDGAVPLNASSD